MAEQIKPVAATPGVDTTLLGAEHVRVYRETNGETGYIWNGAPILLVTTTGRKSGEARTIPIIYRQVGDAQVIIASKGGSASHPACPTSALPRTRHGPLARAGSARSGHACAISMAGVGVRN